MNFLAFFQLFDSFLQVNVLFQDEMILGFEFLLPSDTFGYGFELNSVFVEHDLTQLDHFLSRYLLLWFVSESFPVFHQLNQFPPELFISDTQGHTLSFVSWLLVSWIILCLFLWAGLNHVTLEAIKFVLEFSILLFELSD